MTAIDQAVSLLSTRGMTGPEFYELAARVLCEGAGCRWAAIAERCTDGESATFLARWSDGARANTSTYELAGTPCAAVYEVDPEDPHWFFPGGLAETFSDDVALVKMGARSYRGELFYGNDGMPAGHVFIMNDQPMIDDERIRTFFRLVAQRVGAEYNRWTAEERLKKSESRARDFASSTADWFWEMDETLRYRFVTDGYFKRFKSNARNIIGKTRQDVVGEDEMKNNPDKWRRHFEDLAAHRPFRDFVVSRDDGTRMVNLTGVPFFDDDGNFKGYRGSSTDITKSKYLETALAQSQKMEAVGQLTGGIAHDFNNLLQAISGASAIARENPADFASWLNRIDETVDRGSSLTGQLLAFSRQQDLTPETINLRDAIFDVEEILRRSLGADIELSINCADDVASLRLDVHGLQNALLNMCVNARSAMPDGGSLRIDVQEIVLESEQFTGGELLAAGKYLEIRIADTGFGMTQEVLNLAFDPFFTTKQVGEGTGLGLSMVYGFARQSGGMTVIESEPDVGTTVIMTLPTSERPAAPKVADQPATNISDSQGTILVVEDDPDVRTTTCSMLKMVGYDVLQSENGHNALEMLNKHNNIDLVFSDVVMPGGMSGFDLVNEITKMDNQPKILLTSGYPADADNLRTDKTCSVPILAKPFSMKRLREELSGILEAP
jgi:two-component system CheB/CheR fusion protein